MLLGQKTALVSVPASEPSREALSEFFVRKRPVAVRVERGHNNGAEESVQSEAALTFGFSGQLIAHGFDASRYESHDWPSAKQRHNSSQARRAARLCHLCDFTPYELIEASQLILRLVLYPRPDHGGDFIHLLRETLGFADCFAEFLQPSEVKLFEFFELEDAFEKAVIALPRLADDPVDNLSER